MGTLLDVYTQWFFIMVVYRYEWLLLPLVALILLWNKQRWWWRLLRLMLIFLTFLYLGWFRMHWYSWIAWPLMLSVVGFDWARQWWYRVLGFHQNTQQWATAREVANLPNRIGQWTTAFRLSEFLRSRRQRLTLAAGVVGIGLLFFLRIPFDLFVILVIVAICTMGLMWLFALRADDQRLFNAYLTWDPRMVWYLDWLRWLRADRAQLPGSILAHQRMPRDEAVTEDETTSERHNA